MWSKYLLRVTDTQLGSAVLGVLATTALGLVLTLIATNLFGDYGFALFVATPFVLGFFSSILHGLSGPRHAGEAVAVGTISVS